MARSNRIAVYAIEHFKPSRHRSIVKGGAKTAQIMMNTHTFEQLDFVIDKKPFLRIPSDLANTKWRKIVICDFFALQYNSVRIVKLRRLNRP